jgi:hypothetical protein
MAIKNPYKTKFFYKTNEVNVWDVYSQTWTGRAPAARVAMNHKLLATPPFHERDRIRRMAVKAKSCGVDWLTV